MWIKDAAKVANVSTSTISRRVKDGTIRSTKLPNGKIMCWDDDVYALIGRKLIKENWTVVYTRVNSSTESSRKLMQEQQQLVRQWCLQRGLQIDKLYEDWAPSTDFRVHTRPGLHELLQDIIKKRVSVVIVETPDRLARVGWSLFPELFRYYGVELVIINKAIQHPEYLKEQEKDLSFILEEAGKVRVGELVDPLPKPKKDTRTNVPAHLREKATKISPDWDNEDLSTLM